LAVKKKAAEKKVAKKKVAKKKKGKGGRPKIVIPWDKVDKLLQAHCTGTQVAASLNINPETLYRACEREHKVGFVVYSGQKKESGVSLLKAIQFNTALKGSIPMQIFLGKNYAGQKDKPEPDKTSNKGSIMDTMDKLMSMKEK